MPNRFQIEIIGRNGIINGRKWTWQTSQRQRVPVEIVGKHKSDILTTREQRAFRVLEKAGEWRRLAAERLAEGNLHHAELCKQAAVDALTNAIRARLEALGEIERAA